MKNKYLLFSILYFSLFAVSALFAQNASTVISGTITDRSGRPIPDAYVAIKGTKEVVSTNENGFYSLTTTKSFPFTLQTQIVGYKPKEILLFDAPEGNIDFNLIEDGLLEEVVVSSRRRDEAVTAVPIAVSVIGGQRAEVAGAFNVNRLKELVPSVQLYSSNARNTGLNIRGLGSTFGLTNDGIEPGVGFYIDGVYHARPAATALDFVDVERIEVLRGPQGTLFGKNTTAGAFNIITRQPTFEPTGTAELSYGNYNFIQAKASVSAPVAKNLAARLSFSGTQRQGTLFNENTLQNYNGLNNIGLKGQLLYAPNEKLQILASGDYNNQRPDGMALVVAGITPTERNAHRQYDRIVSDLGYAPIKIDPFSRKIDSDSPWRHNQELGGAHINVDYKIGNGKLTSTTAWRFWNWNPSNDRDFTNLPNLTKSQAPSRHDQFSQEIRYSGEINNKIKGVVGLYYLDQTLRTPVSQQEEVGSAHWRFQQTSTSAGQALWATPGLLDGYGIKTDLTYRTQSAAAFANVDWEIWKGIFFQPGIRFNYDAKQIDYARTTYGGLVTSDPALLALKRQVYSNQAFVANADNTNLSFNATLSYRPNDKFNAYGTFSTNYKSIGLNVGGIPNAPNGRPDSTLITIKPEYVTHYEVGVKTKPFKNAFVNVSLFNTDIRDYQTLVQSPQLGVNRGYLANADRVNVKGFEIDAAYQVANFLVLNGALTYLDGRYVSFTNAPLPLEATGRTIADANGVQTVQQAFTDASGGRLPGISKWNVSLSAELSTRGVLFDKSGRYFIASDVSYRSDYSSNPTPSRVLNIDAYTLVNARAGFRSDVFSLFFWGRNIANANYFEQLQAAAGNAGLYAGVLGDPRTYGITLSASFK